LRLEGTPPWAISIVIAKFVLPRKSELTWGDQAPDWYPDIDGPYEPKHGHHEAIVRRRASLNMAMETPEASMRAVSRHFDQEGDNALAGLFDGESVDIEMTKQAESPEGGQRAGRVSLAAQEAMRQVAAEGIIVARDPLSDDGPLPPRVAPGPLPPTATVVADIPVVGSVPVNTPTSPLGDKYQKAQAAAQAAMLLGRKR
jgi:hypothetical protein